MDVTVKEIYEAALAIMHERGTVDYAERTPAIINTLIGRSWLFSEEHDRGPHGHWRPVKDMEDVIRGVDRSIALSAMPYGLAAMLYLDEDPDRSNSWWEVWQENLNIFKRNRPGEIEPITDMYGGFGYEGYGRW